MGKLNSKNLVKVINSFGTLLRPGVVFPLDTSNDINSLFDDLYGESYQIHSKRVALRSFTLPGIPLDEDLFDIILYHFAVLQKCGGVIGEYSTKKVTWIYMEAIWRRLEKPTKT